MEYALGTEGQDDRDVRPDDLQRLKAESEQKLKEIYGRIQSLREFLVDSDNARAKPESKLKSFALELLNLRDDDSESEIESSGDLLIVDEELDINGEGLSVESIEPENQSTDSRESNDQQDRTKREKPAIAKALHSILGTATARDERIDTGLPNDPITDEDEIELDSSGRLASIADDEDLDTEMMIKRLSSHLVPLKRIFRTDDDLKIKTSKGAWVLSLPYFQEISRNGAGAAVLDVDNFISVNKLALRGVLDAAAKKADPDKDPGITAMVKKIQNFLLNLYGNIGKVMSPAGRSFLPDVGAAVSVDDFLLIESDLKLFNWNTVEEVRQFRSIFFDRIATPVESFMKESSNRLSYLKSVIRLVEKR
jgi:hypothetical protein